MTNHNDDKRPEDVIAECDAVIAEYGEATDDPVAAARVLDAYYTKAVEFWNLERYADVITACQTFLELQAADDSGSDRPVRARLSHVLELEFKALGMVGRDDRSRELAHAFVVRFGGDDHPRTRRRVAQAMLMELHVLLVDEANNLDEALAISDRLLARLDDEPEANLAVFCRLLLKHVEWLQDARGAGFSNAIAVFGELAFNGLTGLLDSGLAAVEPRVAVAGGVRDLITRWTPTPIALHRRRLVQAERIASAVLARIDGSDDPDRQAIIAHATHLRIRSQARLGHIAAVDSDQQAADARDPVAAAKLYLDQAKLSQRRTDLFSQFQTVVYLFMRARALGDGDERITRIAFDDLIAEHLPARPPAVIRLVIRLLRRDD